jgi:rod shape-determining protein MreB and related proteins
VNSIWSFNPFVQRSTRRWQNRLPQFSDNRLYLDPGSSYTRVYLGKKLVINEPTCLAIHRPTQSVVAVGAKAAALLGKSAKKISVSFPIQAGAIADTQDFSLFLNTILERVFPDFSLRHYLLGIPSSWALPGELSPVKRGLFDQSIRSVNMAGYVPHKQVAAAAASLNERTKESASEESFFLVSVGGQKTECAVFSAGELVHIRTFIWGGVKLTETIQRLVRAEHSCALGWHAAEQAKKQMGVLQLPSLPLAKRKERKASLRGKDLITQASKTIIVSSGLFQEEWQRGASELLDLIQQFLSEVPTDLVTSSLERGLYLTGGSSYLEGWSDFLGEQLQCPVHLSPQPELDVVRGLVKLSEQETEHAL